MRCQLCTAIGSILLLILLSSSFNIIEPETSFQITSSHFWSSWMCHNLSCDGCDREYPHESSSHTRTRTRKKRFKLLSLLRSLSFNTLKPFNFSRLTYFGDWCSGWERVTDLDCPTSDWIVPRESTERKKLRLWRRGSFSVRLQYSTLCVFSLVRKYKTPLEVRFRVPGLSCTKPSSLTVNRNRLFYPPSLGQGHPLQKFFRSCYIDQVYLKWLFTHTTHRNRILKHIYILFYTIFASVHLSLAVGHSYDCTTFMHLRIFCTHEMSASSNHVTWEYPVSFLPPPQQNRMVMMMMIMMILVTRYSIAVQ